MAKWTEEEEEKLLELYQKGNTYQEMAEAVHRSVGSVTGKLYRLKKERKKTQEPIYTGEGGGKTQEGSSQGQGSLRPVDYSFTGRVPKN